MSRIIAILSLSALLVSCATHRDHPAAIFVKDTNVIVVAKVQEAYAIESHTWIGGEIGHTTGTAWHLELLIDTPIEWRGLRPHLIVPTTDEVDYRKLVGKVVSVSFTPEQARSLFITFTADQIRPGSVAEAHESLFPPIRVEDLK